MAYTSINPATGAVVSRHPAWTDARLAAELPRAAAAAAAWRSTDMAERTACLARAAGELRAGLETYAVLITEEMGKPIWESRAEIEKCALCCDFYAIQAAEWLSDIPVATSASKSLISVQALGTVLAIMPWNFPFWQVFRAAVPALAVGNGILLKHAPNVPMCAEAIERLWLRAGLPESLLRWLPITHEQAERLIGTDAVQAVTLTGSERAGRRIATVAGAALKKTVLELGGSDPFVVLEDADLERAAEAGVVARFQNSGQSCIAAKRFILMDAIADEYLARFRARVEALKVGDPLLEETRVGPLARADLRDALHDQIVRSIAWGAELVTGGHILKGPGFFYAPTILDRAGPGCPAHDEETFGPLAPVVRVPDEAAALTAANNSVFGLGGSVWTGDADRGERFARRLDAGLGFINAVVRSDPRLPFGGIKKSGYGRELGSPGLTEFANVKTLCWD